MNRKPTDWPKCPTLWFRTDTRVNISVPFTWDLPKAKSLSEEFTRLGCTVSVGGPAVRLIPEYLGDLSSIEDDETALVHTNPYATRTTKGCSRGCSFCGVSKIFGEFVELDSWEPGPILCDDNFLLSSDRHFNRVIDSLKRVKGVDFNQGLDARLLTPDRLLRFRELKFSMMRFSWDQPSEEKPIRNVIEQLLKSGFPKSKIGVYVLINFGETVEEALYRMMTLREMGVRGFAMRYQPLDTLKKNSYIHPNWTQFELSKFMRYWNRQRITAKIPYDEFDPRLAHGKAARSTK